MREIENYVAADSTFNTQFKRLFNHAIEKDLVKDKAYKEALLELSKNDSIQLIINLPDSTINLSMKGTIIHHSKIKLIEKDKFFDKLSIAQEVKLLSMPLSIFSIYTPITKEPVVVRYAPKDTIEASLNAWQPDTLIQKPAYVSLVTQHQFRILIEQENKDIWNEWKFNMHLSLASFKSSVINFCGFNQQQYIPTIKIRIPAEDIRAVYRALPANSYVVLKI